MSDNFAATAPKPARHALLIGVDLLCVTTVTLVAASLLMIVGSAQLEYGLWAALLVTAFAAWCGVSRYFSPSRVQIWIVHLVVVGLIFGSSVVLASQWLDTTRDGQGYHSEAILSLGQGWNPYRTNAPDNTVYPEWIGYFAKGAWVNAAVLYRLTGNIESGKAFSVVLLVASFLVAYAAFRTQPKLPARHAGMLSLLLALNPVSIYQLFSFYVDGQLASCVVILVCLLLLLVRHFDALLLLPLAMVAVLLIDLKLNGPIYLAALLGGYLLWIWTQKRTERWQATGILFAAGLAGAGIVGYNPYISQYVRAFLATGNPLYPTQWYDLIQIDINTPVGLLNQSRWTRLLLSIFSQSQVGLEAGTLKAPFLIVPQELLNFRHPDTRLGGFGPLFSGALVLSTLIGLGGLWLWRKTAAKLSPIVWRNLPAPAFSVFLLVLLIVTILISDQGWWARYAPQFWMLPVLTASLALTSASVWLRRTAHLLVLVLFINAVLIGSVYLALGIVDQSTLRQDLGRLQVQSVITPVEVNFNKMPMTQWRFDRWKINYHTADDLPVCTDGQDLRNVIYSLSIVCADH